MRASLFAILFVHWCAMAAVGAAGADDFRSLGYREDTVIESGGRDDCIGTFIYNHDYSFENGYGWNYVLPPYYGAFGEAFDVGPATVECGLYWCSGIGGGYTPTADLYIWDGGMTGPPGEVLCYVPSVELIMGYWPTCSFLACEIGCCVSGEFTVGLWQSDGWGFMWGVCADENGPGGHPWTCVVPGLGYPSGWQHPDVVWPNCRSLGIGATITEEPSPIESVTWGAIKSLFR